MLERYRDAGVKRVVALRGDMPSGLVDPGEFRYANELVAFIRQEYRRRVPHRSRRVSRISPAGAHGAGRSDQLQAQGRCRRRFRDHSILSINPDAYFAFVDECQADGIDIPIVPGIMPINRFSQLARFSDACGAEIPRWMRRKLEGFGDDTASIRSFGLDVVTQLCDRLLRGGAPGLHFYTLNQAGPATTIWQRLGLS